jgi:biopolymer transport protein ExbB
MMASWIILIEWLARLILLGLLGLSVWSISIIIERRRFLKNFSAQDNNENIFSWIEQSKKQVLLEWAEKNQGIRSGTIIAALKTNTSMDTEHIEKSVASHWARERKHLERGLPILGTLGSTTPFVGLLGTILGIIVSFGALSSGMIDSQKIMSSLAEALIMTAVGLAVAIPAVVAYNYFSRQLIGLYREAEAIRDAIIAQFSERSK